MPRFKYYLQAEAQGAVAYSVPACEQKQFHAAKFCGPILVALLVIGQSPSAYRWASPHEAHRGGAACNCKAKGRLSIKPLHTWPNSSHDVI